MNKMIKLPLFIMAIGLMFVGTVSCTDETEETNSTSSAKFKSIIEQYVNWTVIDTYRQLADNAIVLQQACEQLKANPTQANVQVACDKWIIARKYWEQSEAFLYGAAGDYNIDPHIDSWPLDQNQLDNLLSNSSAMENFSADYAGTYLGYGLLGFHALEYVLFRDGAARNINQISANELKYAQGVSEDLCRQCIRLEASWAGINNITSDKRSILEACELEPSMNYGDVLISAGESGNVLYKTQKAAISQILMGCSDIADEVGNTKIADPVASGNVLDVESWYSWNSIEDFADNIRSIENAYMGGAKDHRNLSYSVSNHIATLDSQLDTRIQNAITKAINEIEAMPAPFRNHLTEQETNAAKTACQNLMSLLNQAIELVNN